jgi:hypothetical protein
MPIAMKIQTVSKRSKNDSPDLFIALRISMFYDVSAFAYTILFAGSDTLQKNRKIAHCLFVERIIHPFPLLACAHQSAITEDLHMMRKSGLCDVELRQYLAGAKLPAG